MDTRLVFLHALSPLHPGTGQGVGVIDLPIAREVATGLPYLPGSSLKGVLRDRARTYDMPQSLRWRMFGPDSGNAELHAGSLQIADQRLLLFPVRSLKGTFAWVTSPFVLQRLKRDVEDSGRGSTPAVPTLGKDQQRKCLVSNQSALTNDGAVYLEDLDLTMDRRQVDEWATWLGTPIFPAPTDEPWRAMLAERLCVVHDDVLSFLLTTATEVIARVRMDPDSKSVAQGGLWYEEALPAETILSGLAFAISVKPNGEAATDPATILNDLAKLVEAPLQVGGSATVGRGLCRVRLG